MWVTIVGGVIVAGLLVAYAILNRKYGRTKAEKDMTQKNLDRREEFDSAVDEHQASGGLAGAASRRLRDAD